MNFQKYQLDAYTAIQEHSNKKDEALNWSIGLGEECGELLWMSMTELRKGYSRKWKN